MMHIHIHLYVHTYALAHTHIHIHIHTAHSDMMADSDLEKWSTDRATDRTRPSSNRGCSAPTGQPTGHGHQATGDVRRRSHDQHVQYVYACARRVHTSTCMGTCMCTRTPEPLSSRSTHQAEGFGVMRDDDSPGASELAPACEHALARY